MKSIRDVLRRPVERFPVVAESYRLLRDYLRFRTSVATRTPHGFKLAGNEKMAGGSFEPVETRLIAGELRRHDVFVDVGANVGYYTCLARTLGLHVVAVEPAVPMLRFLYANLRTNGFGDVEVFPVGLSDEARLELLYGGGGSASLMAGWSRSSDVYATVVPTSTLDYLLGDRFLERRLFVKIDVEGLEYSCLLGARSTIARAKAPTWFVEIYPVNGQRGTRNEDFASTFELFWRHGYEACVATEGRPAVRAADVDRWQARGETDHATANYLFSKGL